METQQDGKVMIENGKRFPGPVELIEYHRSHRDGLLTYPTIACNRPPGESFVVFRGVSAVDLENILMEKAKELNMRVCICLIVNICLVPELLPRNKISTFAMMIVVLIVTKVVLILLQINRNDLLNADIRQRLINEVKANLHTSQPWFHNNITRDQAEQAMSRSGHEDGKYL